MRIFFTAGKIFLRGFAPMWNIDSNENYRNEKMQKIRATHNGTEQRLCFILTMLFNGRTLIFKFTYGISA